MLAGLSYPALPLPGFVFFCFAFSPSSSCGNRGRGSPAIIRVLGEPPWLRAGEAMIRIILSA